MVQTDCVKKNKILIIGGATAVGKSELAVSCAEKFNGEVVGADSMQIYKRMDIGTGKITEREKRGIPHHMIDIISPDETYSAGMYLKQATMLIDDIILRKKLPVITGGTGLYINAILNGLNFSDASKSETVRKKWLSAAEKHGNEYIYEHLKEIDAESAKKINPNDLKRLVRALEIYEVTGKPKSKAASASECKYSYLFLVLDDDRAALYSRINERVDRMFKQGFFKEAESLIEYKNCQSMQAIGYKQIFEFIDGKFSNLEETKEEIKKLTRNYAKRQLTFFRGIKADKQWIKADNFCDAYASVEKFLNNNN